MKPLDSAYEIGAYIEGAASYPPLWAARAEQLRNRLGPRAELGVRYGSSERQVFDFFNTKGTPQGTMVFVHGGYWKAFDQRSWSQLAAGALDAGWSVAMPGYDLCPDVKISEITQQIASAVELIASQTDGPIVLSGHSAGGHLVSRMLDPRVTSQAVRDRIQRVVPISPIADLVPLLQISMNDILRLDAQEAAAESPVRMAPLETEVRIWIGAEERPVLLEQARALAASWDVPLVVVPQKHHFNVIEALEDAQSDLVRFLTGQ